MLAARLIGPPQSTTRSVSDGGDFSESLFRERLSVAEWLADYDRVAWEASDLVGEAPKSEREKLDGVWFCYQESGAWHATSGRFNYSVRELEDGRIEVRWLPAIQPEGIFYWGIDFRFVPDHDGRTIELSETNGTRADGIRLGSEDVPMIDNADNLVPSVTHLRPALLGKRVSQPVVILSSGHTSTVTETEDGTTLWFHGVGRP